MALDSVNWVLWQKTLYPLGWMASLLFGLRFVFQWIYSEKRSDSLMPSSFLWTSILAHISMALHALIQLQGLIFVGQWLQLLLAWRQLEISSFVKPLFGTQKKTTWILISSCLFLSFLFFIFFGNKDHIIRPSSLWHIKEEITYVDLSLGVLGALLYYIRFLVLWLKREAMAKSGKTTHHIPEYFWILSMVGSLCGSYYFLISGDPVNLVGFLSGFLIYARNLQLALKNHGTT